MRAPCNARSVRIREIQNRAPGLRVLILDFDGVVIESNAVKTLAFQQVFARFPDHADAMMEFHHTHVSASRFEKFDHLLGLAGRRGDGGLRDELAADFSARVLQVMTAVPLVRGAESFLRSITPRVPTYLASVTPEAELAVILERLGLRRWFRGVYGCPPWTKADAILDVLEREAVKPDEALLIGDSAGDQRAAGMTGVNFLARDSGLSFDSPAPRCFADLNELSRHVNEWLT